MCPAKNKVRGNKLEYEVVEAFRDAGYQAERAWGSNGRALGHDEQVDVLVDKEFKIQCKRRKTLPAYFGVEELERLDGKYDALVLRQDRGKPLVCMSLERFLGVFYGK